MDPETGSDDPDPIPGGGWKLIKHIIGKLKDWAALSVIALYLLAVPTSYALKDPTLAFGMAFVFSVLLALLRGYQMALESRNLTTKIDSERALKLQKAQHDFDLKLAKLNKPSAPASSPVPSVPKSPPGGRTSSTQKRSLPPPKPKPAEGT